MNWWNRNGRFAARLLVAIGVVTCLILVAVKLLDPIVGRIFCTITDCIGDGIHVNLVGQVPDNYTVEIEFPSSTRGIACFADSPRQDSGLFDGDSCKSKGVFFEQVDSKDTSDLPPEELVVTVIYEEKQITRTFRPEYEVWYANGEYCPPMCYFATIEFDLSE